MLSNLSDLLMSRVDPDPVKAQTAMVAMSPQSQAQAMQPVAAAPAEAQYLQAAAKGKPGKTPQNVLDYLKLMEEGGVYTPPGEVPAFLNEGNQQAQGGKPTKKLNLSGVKTTTTDLEGDANNPYKALLKGKYGTKEVNYLTGKYETEEDTYRRFLLGHNVGGEKLDRALYIKERMMEFKSKIPDSVTGKAKEKMLTDYLNKIQKEGPVAW
jgi:hypothetical protein